MTAAKAKTAAVYARYSSIMQKESSIAGQVLTCERLAQQHGLRIIQTFSDSKKSGKSEAGRDGYAAMMAAVRNHAFDVLIIEDLSRLSRDPLDGGRLKKVCMFHRVEILSQKGWQGQTEFAVHGLVSTIDNASRAINVRRGQSLRLSQGGVPGAPAYGYRIVLGKPCEHEINPETAPIVVRIFTEYATGRSPRAIAADLTREGIPTPASHRDVRYKNSTIWNSQAFVGGMYAKGILGNRKYIGEIDWNTHTTEENPETRKKVKRPTKAAEQTKELNPRLRIIDQALWDAAQQVRQGRAVKKFGPGGKVSRRPVVARGDHLLSGLLRCGACNGHMRITNTSRGGTSRTGCAAAHQHGTCTHSKTYDLDWLKSGILDGMVKHLNSTEAMEAALEAYRDEKKLGERNDSERKAVERKLNALNVEITRLVDATLKIANPPAEFYKKIDAKEVERASLDERMRQLGGPSGNSNLVPFPVSASPKFKDVYSKSVLAVHMALTKNPDAVETRLAFRNLIDTIVVHPTGKRMPYEFTPYATIAALQGLNHFPARRTTKEVIAAEGYPSVASTPNQSFPAWRYRNSESGVVSLGRWRMAA